MQYKLKTIVVALSVAIAAASAALAAVVQHLAEGQDDPKK